MDKEDHSGENTEINYCTTLMKGWRESMEDEHISEIDIGDQNSLFCVFDGHGG